MINTSVMRFRWLISRSTVLHVSPVSQLVKHVRMGERSHTRGPLHAAHTPSGLFDVLEKNYPTFIPRVQQNPCINSHHWKMKKTRKHVLSAVVSNFFCLATTQTGKKIKDECISVTVYTAQLVICFPCQPHEWVGGRDSGATASPCDVPFPVGLLYPD